MRRLTAATCATASSSAWSIAFAIEAGSPSSMPTRALNPPLRFDIRRYDVQRRGRVVVDVSTSLYSARSAPASVALRRIEELRYEHARAADPSARCRGIGTRRSDSRPPIAARPVSLLPAGVAAERHGSCDGKEPKGHQ